MFSRRPTLILLAVLSFSTVCLAQSSPDAIGQFSSQRDVGTVLHAGTAKFDAAQGQYTISGSGENTWATADAFHYVWKKMDGDVALSAEIAFANGGGNPHKKAMLMIRQSLDPDSIYVDVARHGNGLTSLQYRNATSDLTREIELSVTGPQRVRIAKRGDFFYVWYAGADGKWVYSGASMKLPLKGDFYVGLGVCAHDKDATETATFSAVKLTESPVSNAGMGGTSGTLYSTLEVVPIGSTDRRVVYVEGEHFEAPNWLADGSGFLVNEHGRIEKIGMNGEAPAVIDSGSLNMINNDHVLSPDGKRVAISDNTVSGGSRIYTLPLRGGTPQKITENAPSYAHGWSPDGKTITFCGERNGEFDVYTIPAAGGEETRLTTAKGLDDGPNYSPDGKYIYFNSERTGHMQIWRMLADGSEQEQVTHEAANDWFAHISPDGKWMVYLAYAPDVTGHPPAKDVTLQLMSLPDDKTSLLAKLFGGQGTINVPSWSPDSARVAFVSYAFVPEMGE
ncbi:MAG TPA: hypothetical protein VFW25_11210 [Silvibacterium sp.]|nr:hypothetical protein [Silvibacterium sp.]